MKVSVLLPTRERPEMCEESIKSLGEGDFEVLLYLDDDDSKLMQYKDMAANYNNIGILIEPRLTYTKFHEMINRLAEEAKGDWLLLWNDDAIMHGDWIDFEADHNKVRVMRFGDEDKSMNLFPAISRKMYELQGFYSLSTHCDSWAMDISHDLDCEVWVFGMRVEHIRDRVNDETKQQSAGAYKITSPLYNSDEMQAKRHKIVEKLKPHV